MRAMVTIEAPGAPLVTRRVEGTWSAGGGPGDDLVVASLPPRAALLRAAVDGIVVEALGDDVMASGRPLPSGGRRLVRPGERAVIGGHVVAPCAEAPPEGTRALVGAVLAGMLPAAGPALVVLDGPDAGSRLAVRDGADVGRGSGSALRISDGLVSRRHLALDLRDGAVRARDVGSKNGTWVGTRRLRAAPRRLADSDVLTMGSTRLAYASGERAQAAAGSPDAPWRGGGARTQRSTPRPRAHAVFLAAAALAAAATSLALAAP